MLMVLGARRRWPFRREGPNRSALHLEVSGSVGGDHENRSSAWAEGRVLGVVRVGIRDMAPRRHRQVRELVEQKDESDIPAQGEHGNLGRQQWEVSLQYLPQCRHPVSSSKGSTSSSLSSTSHTSSSSRFPTTSRHRSSSIPSKRHSVGVVVVV
ncbi:hypothetical protein Taro_044927 [Colocasia esculenta]|uniref:Uncharacterized protein n=1 Tax=Colocasia esculenta TaxID=4460 RepID=A0A843X3G6_COLES|nr:hypothetical protein [Colocasia esculenta]